jgi:hypothetical protein
VVESPLGHRPYLQLVRVEASLGPHELFSGLVGEPEPEVLVDVGLVLWFGAGENVGWPRGLHAAQRRFR